MTRDNNSAEKKSVREDERERKARTADFNSGTTAAALEETQAAS